MTKAFGTQAAVIWALILRETRTRFGAYRYFSLLWLFVEPLMHIAIFWAVFAMLGRHVPYGMPVPLFLLSGVLPWLLFARTAIKCMSAIESNRALLYYQQVTPVDLVFARAALEAMIMVTVLFVMLAAAAVAGFTPNIANGIPIATGFFLTMILGGGIGLILAGLSIVLPFVEQIVKPCLRIMYFASGVFFTVESVPSSVRDEMLLNPVMHLIDVIRGGFFRAYSPKHSSLEYAAWFSFCALALGLVLERVNRKKVIV